VKVMIGLASGKTRIIRFDWKSKPRRWKRVLSKMESRWANGSRLSKEWPRDAQQRVSTWSGPSRTSTADSISLNEGVR
jgi:hypothetical protein